ncbi:transcriptional regulator [Aeromicrobium sp. A1-2]|uniref:sigma-54-dependent Fis family transcriptional regulator n=1 Tax=Aeromicrobium sp. A1-2 TaxID=2107713 RepID=UPI000E49E3C2|nr:helix-turn-helix domain-containing protein [Aeromicrobium sp. A1-2]AXT85652.1 transcriptional regulator [Aeromicrobium sp. A1-2]
MRELAERWTEVADARADFLSSGRTRPDAVPAVVAASWARSASAGVDATNAHAVFHEDLDVFSRLVRCSQPVIDRLHDDTSGMSLSILLTDNKARVLSRYDSSARIGARLDDVSLAPGFNYAEGAIGTNGIGTVFESGKPVTIVGPEHFNQQLQPFACSGSPIRDPLTGRVEGVLDISCLTEDSSPLMHSLVISAAHDIERNLLVDRSQCQQALFETFIRLDARTRGAVMAIGGTVVMGNAMAQSLFDAEEQSLIHEHARWLMIRHDQSVEQIELPSGKVARVRGTRIVVGADIAGIVVAVDIVAELTSSAGDLSLLGDQFVDMPTSAAVAAGHGATHSGAHTAGGERRSALWTKASDGVAAALTHAGGLLLMGEPGSGKATLAADVFDRLHPTGTVIVVDAEHLQIAEPQVQPTEGSGPSFFVLKNVDTLDDQAVKSLQAWLTAIRAEQPTTRFAATINDANLESALPFRRLLPAFASAVTVPPLRHRLADLPAVVDQLIARLADQRRVTVSPAAMRVLARYTWPRNIRHLESALTEALSRRPVGEIQVDDLPGYCHSGSARQLSGIESMERDLIVSALRDADGNRVQAAATLGIARSSLYRKLKSFGITSI